LEATEERKAICCKKGDLFQDVAAATNHTAACMEWQNSFNRFASSTAKVNSSADIRDNCTRYHIIIIIIVLIGWLFGLL